MANSQGNLACRSYLERAVLDDQVGPSGIERLHTNDRRALYQGCLESGDLSGFISSNARPSLMSTVLGGVATRREGITGLYADPPSGPRPNSYT
jgi:hypothetical protein